MKEKRKGCTADRCQCQQVTMAKKILQNIWLSDDFSQDLMRLGTLNKIFLKRDFDEEPF